MLKKIGIVFGVLFTLVLATLAQILLDPKEKPIELSVTTQAKVDYSMAESSPAEIVFRNKDEKPIKLLDIFDNPRARRVLFSILLHDSSGTPFGPFGGGKISLPRSSLKYVEIKKNEEFKVRLDLKEMLPKGLNLPVGSYDAVITYFNQYGENCFQGRVQSNKVHFEVKGSRSTDPTTTD